MLNDATRNVAAFPSDAALRAGELFCRTRAFVAVWLTAAAGTTLLTVLGPAWASGVRVRPGSPTSVAELVTGRGAVLRVGPERLG
ncbi:hypothetical protein GCM10009844_35090 [Nocardioides koreensis]|uniref:Uncharacterized protein n=1 Tax=Nocardioides koreensis TaxID=433651 RepID=A0ABN3A1P2_9ACTN